MKVIRNLEDYHNIESNLVVAFGNFDGVHLGHRSLINLLIDKARSINGTAAVFTFYPHPLQVLRPTEKMQLLLPQRDKEELLAEQGVDLLFSIPFTEEFAKIGPETFISNVIVNRLKVKGIVVGYNFTFGHQGEGDPQLLKKMGLEEGYFVEILAPVYHNNQKVSSTLIRSLLLEGQVSEAKELLGFYPYVKGIVTHGDGRGREIGFPTANLDLPSETLVPATGVYIVKVKTEKELFQGVANIGYRPTFKKDSCKNIEIHLFDFNKDIYNQEIKVEFLEYLRTERTFDSYQDLVAQIDDDVKKAKNFFVVQK